ncbi:MAG TPA: hypothetical protein VLH40_02165 [Atribacteraceae bacterium]|nr:hypothetical protein [Atribacteraceae bacterium]
MKAFAIVLFILCFCIVPAFAGETIEGLIEDASSYSEEDRAYLLIRVNEIVREMDSLGLPTEPVLRKLREGLRKKVLPYNIVLTLESRKSSISEARAILSEIDPAFEGDEGLLINLALSLEHAVPPEAVLEALRETIARDGDWIHLMVDSLSTFLEMGASPQQAASLTREVARRNPSPRDLRRITKLIERARREGVDPRRTAEALEAALGRFGNLNLVEMEMQSFISDARNQPSLSIGQGSIVTEPGISSGGTPAQEGGAPIEATPPSGVPPAQEGGTQLD